MVTISNRSGKKKKPGSEFPILLPNKVKGALNVERLLEFLIARCQKKTKGCKIQGYIDKGIDMIKELQDHFIQIEI